jgi:hypothetical protein
MAFGLYIQLIDLSTRRNIEQTPISATLLCVSFFDAPTSDLSLDNCIVRGGASIKYKIMGFMVYF